MQYAQFNDRLDIFGDFDQNQNIFFNGFNKIVNGKGYKKQNIFEPNNQYSSIKKENVENFNRFLTKIYRSSCVEIVGETIFFGTLGVISEKYFNTIFGCNFPIILNVPGAVKHLREQGFDVFDDIVDQTYDMEPNHAKRMIRAIDDNHRLLTDKKYAVDQWTKCKERFEKNIDHVLRLQETTQQRFDQSIIKKVLV